MADTVKNIRTIRSDPAKLDAIRQQLDEATGTNKSGRTRAERFEYKQKGLVAVIQQPGDGTPMRYNVEPRNLSEGGMSFLHGGFVHKGSIAIVQLITLHGTWNNVPGIVVGCEYISEGIHEVHVQFQNAIEPAQYCALALRFRVLLAEDDDSIARLAELLLTNANADVDRAKNGLQAVEMARANVYDVILMDIDMPEMDGITATKTLRKQGYTGRIIAATAMTQPEDRQRCLDAGCDDYIAKPHTKENIALALQNIHQEPLYSTLAGDAEISDIVDIFVSELPAQVRKLEDAMVSDDVQQLISLTRSLKAGGTSYGFEIVSELAAEIETMLLKGNRIDDVRGRIGDLIKLCLQVRSTARLTDTDAGSANAAPCPPGSGTSPGAVSAPEPPQPTAPPSA